ncbi:MAG: aspartate aminotransferase family protein [Planctomycetes bacterium]|nr:aspartate aminotransferase family protein [Planctomycetota bacterium]
MPTHELDVYHKIPISVARGDRDALITTDGREILDLYGAHAVALVGHGHPRLTAAIRRQSEELLFYSNAIDLPVRARAAEALVKYAGGGWKAFFVNSGTEANEAAMKTARKSTGRKVVVSFEGSFHGRTLAALSASAVPGPRAGVSPLVPDHLILPWEDEKALRAIDGTVAAVILEAIQSLGGVRVPSQPFLSAIHARCRESGAWVIADEVQTAPARTGVPFAHHRWGWRPDIVTTAKGVAGGVPCGVMLVRDDRAASVKYGDHGCTYGGGPHAMAALEATLAIVADERLDARAERLGKAFTSAVRDVRGVRAVRGLGLLLGVETIQSAADVTKSLLEKGILAGTSSEPNTIRLLPPLTVREEAPARLARALQEVLA